MRNLSTGCINVKMGTQIGNTIEVVKTCDVNEEGFGWGKTLLVLIKVDLGKPINRGMTINILGNKHRIPLTFEKLQCICFACGRIIPNEGFCENKMSFSNSSGQ